MLFLSYTRLVVFILVSFPKLDTISEILVHWITLLIAFSHCLESTLSQTFITHRFVFFCSYVWTLGKLGWSQGPIFSFVLPLLIYGLFNLSDTIFVCFYQLLSVNVLCRLELITALSHHFGRQSIN